MENMHFGCLLTVCQAHTYRTGQSQDLTNRTAKGLVNHFAIETVYHLHRQQRSQECHLPVILVSHLNKNDTRTGGTGGLHARCQLPCCGGATASLL